MLPQADIQQYGGKAAILNHVKAKLPDMPIPSYVVKGASDSLDSVMADFRAMKKPVIVRSSSPHEYGDFEGIFESVPNVHDERGLSRAVRQVEESARSERASAYARQNGFDISDKMHVIIQEQSQSRYTGAIMRHPNNPDWIFISYFLPGMFRDHEAYLFDENNPSESSYHRGTLGNMPPENAKVLVEEYKKIESLTDIAEGCSLFVEFGFKPFALYQARPFKKIQTADFEIPDKYRHDTEHWTNFAFGVTPREGIVLPVIKGLGSFEARMVSDNFGKGAKEIFFGGYDVILGHKLGDFGILESLRDSLSNKMLPDILREHNLVTAKEINGPFCYVTTSAQRDQYDVDLSLPGMKALVLSGVEVFLVHNLMRLFKQADVVAGFPPLLGSDFYRGLKSVEDKVRIISNGKEAVVLKE